MSGAFRGLLNGLFSISSSSAAVQRQAIGAGIAAAFALAYTQYAIFHKDSEWRGPLLLSGLVGPFCRASEARCRLGMAL